MPWVRPGDPVTIGSVFFDYPGETISVALGGRPVTSGALVDAVWDERG